jgi:hypothetical protein
LYMSGSPMRSAYIRRQILGSSNFFSIQPSRGETRRPLA